MVNARSEVGWAIQLNAVESSIISIHHPIYTFAVWVC